MKVTTDAVRLGVLLAAGLALAFVARRAIESGKDLAAAVGDAVSALPAAAADAAAGTVVSIGEAIGVPRTDRDACSLALAEGRTWDASFACPAGRWLSEGVFGSTPANGSTSPRMGAQPAVVPEFSFPI
jgi:hypothetical protein